MTAKSEVRNCGETQALHAHKIVVFPALSSPKIKILTSLFPKSPSNSFVKNIPMFDEKVKRASELALDKIPLLAVRRSGGQNKRLAAFLGQAGILNS